jgi:hypothetical protein
MSSGNSKWVHTCATELENITVEWGTFTIHICITYLKMELLNFDVMGSGMYAVSWFPSVV